MTWSTIRANIQAAFGVIDTLGTSAGINGVFEAVLVGPAVEVISVKTITSSITARPSETIRVLDGTGIVEELVVKSEESIGMGLRADSTIIITNSREGNLYSK